MGSVSPRRVNEVRQSAGSCASAGERAKSGPPWRSSAALLSGAMAMMRRQDRAPPPAAGAFHISANTKIKWPRAEKRRMLTKYWKTESQSTFRPEEVENRSREAGGSLGMWHISCFLLHVPLGNLLNVSETGTQSCRVKSGVNVRVTSNALASISNGKMRDVI